MVKLIEFLVFLLSRNAILINYETDSSEEILFLRQKVILKIGDCNTPVLLRVPTSKECYIVGNLCTYTSQFTLLRRIWAVLLYRSSFESWNLVGNDVVLKTFFHEFAEKKRAPKMVKKNCRESNRLQNRRHDWRYSFRYTKNSVCFSTSTLIIEFRLDFTLEFSTNFERF